MTLHFLNYVLMTLNQNKNRKLRHNRSFEERTTDYLINSIPITRLLIASLVVSISVLKALPGKLDIERRKFSILYVCEHQFECKMLK